MGKNFQNEKQFTKPDIQFINYECLDVLLNSPASENAFGFDLSDGFFSNSVNEEVRK